MSIIKCKMCGGTLEITENATIAACEYCGTTQTLPKLGDDRRANLYDRAGHFRRNNDFDKAMGIYEKILNDDPTDAEAYWSIVLCRYGIEYVEDPATRKRIPTINRAQFTSIFDDDNYKSALQHAESSQRALYEDEAHTINEIQKGILAISQKEEPFDVFICYKETDNNGRRTPDSVLANELYHELSREGYKVFFSRITLEDKLGVAYEPYIFAALNSAKVMVVLGTKPEYFNAVWVKNEWSRYLTLIKNGARKILIPAYRDMDPYDLPEEFAHLQAQDMAKLGFMQDLIRGIKKITDMSVETPVKEVVAAQQNTPVYSSNVGALLERGNMALEDGEWKKADDFFEDVLNQDAKNADAYLGKTLAAEQCSTLNDLVNKRLKSTETAEYKKQRLQESNEHISQAIEKYSIARYLDAKTISSIYCDFPTYQSCVESRKAQKTSEELWWNDHKQLSRAIRFASGDCAERIQEAYDMLMKQMDERIAAAEDELNSNEKLAKKKHEEFLSAADIRAQKEHSKALASKEQDYRRLCSRMSMYELPETLRLLARSFDEFGDYEDCQARALECRQRIEEILAKNRERSVLNKKIAVGVIVALIAAAIIAFVLVMLK